MEGRPGKNGKRGPDPRDGTAGRGARRKAWVKHPSCVCIRLPGTWLELILRSASVAATGLLLPGLAHLFACLETTVFLSQKLKKNYLEDVPVESLLLRGMIMMERPSIVRLAHPVGYTTPLRAECVRTIMFRLSYFI